MYKRGVPLELSVPMEAHDLLSELYRFVRCVIKNINEVNFVEKKHIPARLVARI